MNKRRKHAELIVVAHTHWDREWYLTFQQFRYQLVKLIDQLLDILEMDRDYVNFMLDGQTVVLEDYLEIRPENKERLKKWIEEGRINIGPWYTQPDEFLVSGESLIRNLMLGHKVGKEFGNVMEHGYLPDSFGHISQMPQILQGFDIDTAFIMRGVGDEVGQTEFYWEAPDGSRVLTHYLAAGYGNVNTMRPNPKDIKLPSWLADLLKRITGEEFRDFFDLRDFILSKASTDTLLLMNGGDHLAPQPNLTEISEGVNEKLPDEIIQGTLSDFVNEVRKKKPKLSKFRGEFRSSKYFPVLRGVLSSRIYLKQMNAKTETLLERCAEPISAIKWVLGKDYPSGFFQEAWKLVLKNHAHDSICGCGIDQVHDEMESRFRQAQQIARELIKDGLREIGERVNFEGKDGEIPILVFNPSQWRRTDRVVVSINPTVNSQYGKRTSMPLEEKIELNSYVLKDLAGKMIPFKIEGEKLIPEDILNGVKLLLQKVISFRTEDLPPFGYRVYKLTPGSEEQGEGLAVDDKTIENEFYKVRAQDDGSLIIEDKGTGEIYRNFNHFEDSGDAGDEYNYSPPEEQEVFTSKGIKADIRLIEDEPDRAIIRVDQTLKLPKSLTKDRRGRGKERVDERIVSFVTLQKGVRRIDIRTIVGNEAKDHRLRAVFPTGIKTKESIAESAFSVIHRPTETPEGEGWIEKPSPTHPQTRFVIVEDGEKGIAILNKGLPEYEVTEDGKIYLTLLRCVGWLSRDDLQTREAHVAGPSYETLGAQCIGKHEFEYSILPYCRTWEEAQIWKQAIDFNTPLIGSRIEGKGKLPQEFSFLSVEPDELVISAIKKAEEDNSLIVRLYNIVDRTVEGYIEMYKELKRVMETNLNEEPKKELPMELNSKVPLTVKGFEIKTIKLSF
ncbi:mannosylglycerate hydrolase [Candidatus Hakubella thermalkaliphila]|uniref:Mannosylglycerate hydrolase n=2 Tax=Candidatus Hakubella thermalkaliphila TaxID=2754717 RepID=A0A6V8PS52_9ACTN|nr:glycoside hydrolase family 38 C-terminal domain-containing protein [Candidatus Hakubella thermalkaliphila]GFP27725.1 mannosylglycerate hydrolase [Candidatus Hakubella thermalkaliphila]GFP35117.1 mannosylglycerate hydrolase [Candidatus Hakubella thermalkaliphila]